MGFERGQALIVALGAVFVVMLGAGVLAALGGALAQKGRLQRATDLAALSAARSMRDDFARLFEPPVIDGRPNPRHLSEADVPGTRTGRGARGRPPQRPRPGAGRRVVPGRGAGAPVRVKVEVKRKLHGGAATSRSSASATAELAPPRRRPAPLEASGGGYTGPLAYRQGKPMRPDVALAFDRMEAAARADGVALIVTSGYRSDAEQAELYARHPDPKWVAPPGKSLHRLRHRARPRPAVARTAGWRATPAASTSSSGTHGKPWHYGYTLNPRSTPEPRAVPGARATAAAPCPSFVPAAFAAPIARAASRWNVSAALLAAQLYVESNFNPFARQPRRRARHRPVHAGHRARIRPARSVRPGGLDRRRRRT